MQALLINGMGYFGDCALGPGGSKTPINCSVADYSVPPGRSAQQPWATATNPGARVLAAAVLSVLPSCQRQSLVPALQLLLRRRPDLFHPSSTHLTSHPAAAIVSAAAMGCC